MKPIPRNKRPTTQAMTQGAGWTVVGPGCVVEGELVLAGDLIVHGRIEGTVFAEGTVRIAPQGSVEGGVHARTVVVEGICRGRLEGIDEVDLRAGSLVHGEIDAGVLTIDDKARFFGDYRVGDPRSAPRVTSYQSHSSGNA